jgi:hypothetical protein
MNPLIQGILLPHRPSLAAVFDYLIANSMQSAYQLVGSGARPSEPDFVALLVTQAAPNFATALGNVFKPRGISVNTTSVFCHGRPEVRISAGGCELGDVLFAFFHTDAAGNTLRNSLLLQAKMSASQQHPVGANDQVQLTLYTAWGAFKYTRTSGLSGASRSVTPLGRHAGAQYLLIDSRGPMNVNSGVTGMPGTFPMGTAPAQAHLVLQESLGTSLVNLMLGTEGRFFCERSKATQDWDQVMWDLLEHGFRARFSRRPVGISGHTRRVDAILAALGEPLWRSEGDGMPGSEISRLMAATGGTGDERRPPLERSDEEDGRGVSVIVIETSERERER